MFENDFALNISSEDWDSVWEQAKEFQCVTKHAIQFEIIMLSIVIVTQNKKPIAVNVYVSFVTLLSSAVHRKMIYFIGLIKHYLLINSHALAYFIYTLGVKSLKGFLFI